MFFFEKFYKIYLVTLKGSEDNLKKNYNTIIKLIIFLLLFIKYFLDSIWFSKQKNVLYIFGTFVC